MVDQVLDVLSTERRQRACRNVEYIELIRNVYSNIACQRTADLVDLDVEDHLRARGVETFKQQRCGIQQVLGRTHNQSRRAGAGSDKPDFKQIPKHVHHVVQTGGRINAWNEEGAHGHALVLPAIFGGISGDEYLLVTKRRPECLGDLPGDEHGLVKINVIDIERYAA